MHLARPTKRAFWISVILAVCAFLGRFGGVRFFEAPWAFYYLTAAWLVMILAALGLEF